MAAPFGSGPGHRVVLARAALRQREEVSIRPIVTDYQSMRVVRDVMVTFAWIDEVRQQSGGVVREIDFLVRRVDDADQLTAGNPQRGSLTARRDDRRRRSVAPAFERDDVVVDI